ncbi:unnamed protein product [Cylicocyclus nassatus]|uniref:Uncharacterized protein n=1 Tax=Cylicocyclus nassatus TaxID=53992 RepID=A0AA36HDW2_CYLNA|nr:unnamed protein product [Cylicocyclus nassatus]
MLSPESVEIILNWADCTVPQIIYGKVGFVATCADTLSVMIEENYPSELSVVMFGAPQKNVLFEKLCEAAAKYERHVHYEDVYYLTVNCKDKQEVIEFTDPGLDRTGGREMAIKRADLAILFYSALSLHSLHQLQTLNDDLKMKSNIPLRLICDSDECKDEEDGESTGIASVSEGYNSDAEGEGRIQRRNSMEKIRKASEDVEVAVEQGQQWASNIGPNCEFILLSSSKFNEARAFLEDIIRAIKRSHSPRGLSFIKRLRFHDKSSSGSCDKSSPQKSEQSDGSDASHDRKKTRSFSLSDPNSSKQVPESKLMDYVDAMDKHQKRSLLNLIREGVLTDECFININDTSIPERVQVPIPRVVEAMKKIESNALIMHREKPLSLRIFYAKHYSSASFQSQHRADLDVRSLSTGRFTMPVWYSVLFQIMTLGTFASHIWSQITNYADLQESLSLTVPTIILVVSSELNQIEKRIYATKAIQFILLWYTMILAIYANLYELNIYPALATVLTNGFGLMLFARIAEFFRRCRRTRNGTAIAAR